MEDGQYRKKPLSFAMDEGQVNKVFTEIGKKNEQVTAIYHLHPSGPPIPSRDIQYAHYPDAAYLIISFKSV